MRARDEDEGGARAHDRLGLSVSVSRKRVSPGSRGRKGEGEHATHFAGALMTTFFAPAWRCWHADSVVKSLPVQSAMYSAPTLAQSSLSGSRSLKSWMRRPRHTRQLAPSSMVRSAELGKQPCVES